MKLPPVALFNGNAVYSDFGLIRQCALQRNAGAVVLYPRDCAQNVCGAGAAETGARIHWQVGGVIRGKVTADRGRVGLNCTD